MKSQSIVLYIKIMIGIWVLFAFLVTALQCGPVNPWIFNQDRCAAGGNLNYVIIAFNLITDAILAVFFIPQILRLQMSRTLHLGVSTLFAARLR